MRNRTFPRHIHQWHELLPRGDYAHTTFVVCDLCEKNKRDSVRYLGREATAEFRRQIRHGIKPRFDKSGLIGYIWKANAPRPRQRMVPRRRRVGK